MSFKVRSSPHNFVLYTKIYNKSKFLKSRTLGNVMNHVYTPIVLFLSPKVFFFAST